MILYQYVIVSTTFYVQTHILDLVLARMRFILRDHLRPPPPEYQGPRLLGTEEYV